MASRSLIRPLACSLALLFAAAPALASESQPASPPMGRHGHHADMLRQIDTNGDGKVDAAEAGAYSARRAAEIDTNKDGVISDAEMNAHRDAQREKMRARHVTRLDTNKDGQISVEEYRTHMQERLTRQPDGHHMGHGMKPSDRPAPPATR